MNRYYIGIDTSAYTTSIGVVDGDGNILANHKKMLKVNKGNRGLRQQEAVFQHINNFPELLSKLKKEIDFNKVQAIGYSDQPRNLEDSYMPVFNVSKSLGISLSEVLGIKSYNCSHQEGHIAAGLCTQIPNKDKRKPFISIHLSGGTTEILLTTYKEYRYTTEIIGGTKDISAGQLIDRNGVKMGLNFPSGKYLDELSQKGQLINNIPISTKGNWINFSGPETYFNRLIEENKYSYNDIAKSLLYCVSLSLVRVLFNIFKEFDKIDLVLVVGGVASNTFLRDNLPLTLTKKLSKKVIFPERELCTDNGVGVALLAKELDNKE